MSAVTFSRSGASLTKRSPGTQKCFFLAANSCRAVKRTNALVTAAAEEGGLPGPDHNNGRIEEDVAPRGLAWMEGGGGVLCVETPSPAAVAWHAPASGRTDSSRQCQASCGGRWRGPLSSWGIWSRVGG